MPCTKKCVSAARRGNRRACVMVVQRTRGQARRELTRFSTSSTRRARRAGRRFSVDCESVALPACSWRPPMRIAASSTLWQLCLSVRHGNGAKFILAAMSLTMRRRLTREKLAAAVHGIFVKSSLIRERRFGRLSTWCASNSARRAPKPCRYWKTAWGRCVDVHGVSLRALEPHFKHEPNRAHQQRDPPPH